MKRNLKHLFFAMAVATFANAVAAQTPDAQANALFERCYREVSALSPIGLSWDGDYSANDRLDDLSDDNAQAEQAIHARCLSEARAIAPETLSPRVRESLSVFIHGTSQSIAGYPFREFHYAISPINGWDTGVFQLFVSAHPIRNLADANAYLARVKALPRYLEQVREFAQKAEARGLLLPKPLYSAVYANFKPLLLPAPAHPLQVDFAQKMKTLPIKPAQKQALQSQLRELLKNSVLPAMQTQLAFVQSQEMRAGNEGGLTFAADGARAYAHLLRDFTTTEMDAESIHALGLTIVADLKAKMAEAFSAAGMRESYDENVRRMRADPRFYYADTDAGRRELMADAERYVRIMQKTLPQLFDRMPRAPVVVKRMPKFAEAGDAMARYESPAEDGSKPGVYAVNLGKPSRVPKFGIEVLTYHEALPGHHMQIAIAQETKDLPTFRKRAGYTAYAEGWALYSEQLGKEVGLYKTPLSEIGRLADSMWRAARLVVDTGIHSKGWTRAQAQDYLLALIPHPRDEIIAEVDRYIVWPGQATAYMIGKERIVSLRTKAQAALGARFNLRQFHDTILAAGPVPLSTLEEIVERWIAARQS